MAGKRQQKQAVQPNKPVEPVDPSRRQRLIELRDMLLLAMKSAEPSVMAQLAGQYRQTLKELAELPDDSVQSDWEKARAIRAARRSALKAV